MKMNEFDDQINRRMKPPARKMLNLFLRGLLVVLPIALTVSILIWVLQILGSFLHLDKLSFGAVFLYLILGIVAITFIGKFTEGVVAKQILEFLEGIIEKATSVGTYFDGSYSDAHYQVSGYKYGSSLDSGYYMASATNLYAKNTTMPMVFGASNSTVVSPALNNDPSLIVPGFGFLNEYLFSIN